ncbi:hypothetical protein CRENBAI_009621 [Crenichthys baileyi]|uniref:Fibronectin type-III domain-containing protein n=1 Tax=Crenichthys baileyi TaxID=28760 RepID=A0AAV9RCZ3_9TELE
MDSEKMIEVATLGRPFSLGMLYDCRQDTVIPGLTLWDCDDLEKDKRESPKPNSDFEIVASESIEDKSSSLADAVEVYQSLPKLLGASGENAVPIKVWMLPLTNLDSSAAKLVREISVGLVQEVQSVLEELSELEIRLGFQQTLAKKLPLIRGGGEEESELADVLKRRHSSPFNSKNLNEWMDCKEREIYILKSFTRMMKNTKIIPSQNEVDEEVLSADHALCFVFTSLERHEPYLSALSNHLKGETGTDDSHIYDVEKEQWYLSNNVADEMRRKVKLFSDFAEANKENTSTAFLTVGLTDKKHEGSTIYLYKDGHFVSKNFEPPSKPKSVTAADINHNSVILNISPPLFGAENIPSYSVEYRVSGEDEWKQKIEPKFAELTVSRLKPNTEYVFRCRAVTSAGVGPANAINDPIKTLPCSPPGVSEVEPNSSEISLNWEKPAELGPDVQILSYIVEYASTANSSKVEDLLWNQTRSRGEKATISGLHSETQYSVRVRCDCGGAGRSKENKIVKVCTTKREFGRLAEYLKDISKKTNSSLPSVYELPLRKDDMDIDGCQRYIFGKESLRPNRTIMLLGATGSGKSTLINGMINYMVGVKWNDDFRFKLINEDSSMSQAHSQTSEVTVYEIYHQDGFKIPYSLTVIDTPGFGDTRGVTRDREITEQIRRIFTSAEGVTEIDAVCFVTQASLARLTATQKYVFDSVLSIFGKDVAENIVMLVTFADGKQPPVLEAINVSGVPCPKNDIGFPVHFKFNNSALFAHTKCDESRTHDEESAEDEDESFDEMFWKMGVKSMKKFFTALGKMTPKSLLMTKEVLKERKQLETAIEGLQPQVRAGLAKLEEIKTTKEKIKEHEAIITSNENFEIEVDVIKPIQKQLTGKGEYITNCQKCSITCHYPCMIADDTKKHGCNAMDNKGMCTVCPGKCIWNVHFNQKYKWEYVQVKEKKTVQDLKSKYEKAAKEKLTTEQLIERQEEEIAHLQDIMLSLMDQSANCITRLQEIALSPNPLAAPDYIDMLIEGEKAEAKKGYEARIKSLEEMKEKAQLMSKVSRQDKLTKQEEQTSAARQKRTDSRGLVKRFLNYFGFSG